MITWSWILVCFGLMAGTYLVRALPFWFSRIETLPPGVKHFLQAVPGAALGALLLPDALIGTPPVIAPAVVLVAFVLAARGASITVVVLVTIALAWAGLNVPALL